MKKFFTQNNLDILFSVESWIPPGDLSVIAESLSDGDFYFNLSRPHGRGVGLLIFFKSHINCKLVSLDLPSSSLELLACEFHSDSQVLCRLHTAPLQSLKDFISLFAMILAEVSARSDQILIVGEL